MSKVIVKLKELLCLRHWYSIRCIVIHNKYLSPWFLLPENLSLSFFLLVLWHFASMLLLLPLYSFSLAGSRNQR